jgi:cobalt-zinc-cadmium efflux system outer membrane protein
MWFRSLLILSLLSGSSGALADPLSFNAALSLAERSSADIEAQTAGVDAARSASRAAGALPDPKLAFGVDNLPATGPDQWRVDRDFMTMRKIGVMQDFPSIAKRRAESATANAAVDEADARRRVHVFAVRTSTAIAWLNRYYIERRVALFDALSRENALFAATVQAALAGGHGMPADVIGPKQEAADLADRLDVLRADVTKAKAGLRRLVGADAEEPLLGDPPAFIINADHLRSHVHKHPELEVYGPMIALARAQAQEAEAARNPDWGVELDYARRAAVYSDMVSLQFTVSLPLFSAYRQDPLIDAKHLEQRRLEAERTDMLREHTAALEGELADYTALNNQLARLQDTRLPLAQQKVTYQLASYQGGKADLAAVLVARRELIDAQLMQVDLQNRRDVAAATIYFSYLEPQP